MPPPFEQHLYIVRRFRVAFLGRQPSHTRTEAPVNVELQARPRMRAGQIHGAGRNQESFVNKMQNPPRQACREIGAKIQRTVLPDSPRKIHSRIFLRRGELDVRIGFVVAQHHIEFRQVLLD